MTQGDVQLWSPLLRGQNSWHAAQNEALLALFALENSGFCWDISLWEHSHQMSPAAGGAGKPSGHYIPDVLPMHGPETHIEQCSFREFSENNGGVLLKASLLLQPSW